MGRGPYFGRKSEAKFRSGGAVESRARNEELDEARGFIEHSDQGWEYARVEGRPAVDQNGLPMVGEALMTARYGSGISSKSAARLL